MNEDQLQQIYAWFLSFVEGFQNADSTLPPPLTLKLNHTQHVATMAREIAQELRWSPDDIRLSEALGWLHDVGRFSQFAEFGHLYDATSVNHGQRGLEIVRDSGILSPLSTACQNRLLDGIRHHNAKSIPASVSPDSLPFLKLIRDADKLDIYRVVIDGLAKDGLQELANIWPHIDLHGPISSRLLQEIQTQSHVDFVHVKSLADFLLLQAFWIYELEYAPTRDRIRRDHILETLSTYLPDDPSVQLILDTLQKDLLQPATSHTQKETASSLPLP